jgi:5,10-methylenetetrahydrofolate reductase
MQPLLDNLRSGRPVIAAELRPPRAELETAASMDAWIDTYHAVRSLTRAGTFVFLTDSAVGSKEEDNLRHLVINLGSDVPRSGVVPFLTCKHPIDYCLAYADRAQHHGFDALVVLGGDKSVGAPRCLEHAWQLREEIRGRVPALALGGWANPHTNPAAQVGHLLAEHATAEFYLTQIVSHHSRAKVDAFLAEADKRGLKLPGMFGVFYYRSANPRTLRALGGFLPVPAEELTSEFGSGATADEICARSIKTLIEAGVRHFYVSNLPVNRAAQTLQRIMDLSGAGMPLGTQARVSGG